MCSKLIGTVLKKEKRKDQKHFQQGTIIFLNGCSFSFIICSLNLK